MRGFGAPSELVDGLSVYDWGFGDPTPGGWDPATDALDKGFGSPSSVMFIAIVVSEQVVPDDGGNIVQLAGEWPDLGVPEGLPAGPFRVRVIDPNTETKYPDPNKRPGCYSGRVDIRTGGKGTSCETDLKRTRLDFVMPPCPPGVYDVEVAWGPFYAESVRLTSAIKVVYRNRSMSEYSIRRAFPGVFGAVGNRLPSAEKPLVAADEASIRKTLPMTILGALTRAFGQEAQVIAGVPMTLLVVELIWDATTATVESTLAFPTAAAVFIGGRRYTYTGKTDTTLTGLAADVNDGNTIPIGSEVVLDAASVPAEET